MSMNRVFVPATLIAVLTVFFSATSEVAYAEPDTADFFHTPRSLMLSVLDVIENEYVDPVDTTRLLNAALDGASEATHVALPALRAVLPEPQARLRPWVRSGGPRLERGAAYTTSMNRRLRPWWHHSTTGTPCSCPPKKRRN
jgi:hypothetical protein